MIRSGMKAGALVAGSAFLLAAGCADEEVGLGPGDARAPAEVTDLTAVESTDSTVTLAWTAPGDDGDEGTAAEYDVRYSRTAVTLDSWEEATRVSGVPSPRPAGGAETLTVEGLGSPRLGFLPLPLYHFALRTADEVPNWSGLSNPVDEGGPLPSQPLEAAFDLAGPGEGYDKLVVLDPAAFYTGGLTVSGVSCAIHGNGAVIDLAGGEILAIGLGTTLDVDHCVITNGAAGLSYVATFEPVGGRVLNNTIYGNGIGVRAFYTDHETMVIKNNIIAASGTRGIYARQYYDPAILYNDVYNEVWEDLVYPDMSGPYVWECG